jgi:hypothetical protein
MSKEDDFVNIGTSGKGRGARNIFENFRKKLVEKEQEYVKAYKPYYFKGAKTEWEDKVKTRLAQLGLREDQVTEEQLKINIDLDYYGDLKNFTLHKTVPDEEEVRINLTVQKVLRGYKEYYSWKATGYEIVVFVPLDVWEQRNKRKKQEQPPEVQN